MPPGLGVRARVGDTLVGVGTPTRLPADHDVALDLVAELEQTGHTAVVIPVNGTVAGVFGLTDRVREGAADMVAALTSLTLARPVKKTAHRRQPAGRRRSRGSRGHHRCPRRAAPAGQS